MNESNEHIWSFDCIAICAMLGLTLNPKSVEKLCRKFGLCNDEKRLDAAYEFYLLHKACHQEGGLLPKRLAKFLDKRFQGIIGTVRQTECACGNEIEAGIEAWTHDNPAGVIWALLTDPREPFHRLGVYRVHQLAYAAFQDARQKTGEAKRRSEAAVTETGELERVRKHLTEQQAREETLRARLQRAENEAASLQAARDRQARRIAELEARPAGESRLGRRIRMLEYELEQERRPHAPSGESRGETAGALRPGNSAEPVSARCPRGDAGDMSGDSLERPTPCAAANGLPCPLEALRVAVIGGLDRLEPHYRRAVESMGGQFLFHNGDCHGGGHRLKSVVCRSDIVVFITRVNSHSALQLAKGLCRKTGKRFAVLRETSPHALAGLLRGVA